jgi:hypothetical protein
LNGINLYEQGLSRRYLNLGDDGRAYRYLERGRFEEIPFEEALNWLAEPLTEKGETLETPYDEEHKARPCGQPAGTNCECTFSLGKSQFIEKYVG